MANDPFKIGSPEDLEANANAAAAEEAEKHAKQAQADEVAAAAKHVTQAPEHQSEKLMDDTEVEDALSFLKTK